MAKRRSSPPPLSDAGPDDGAPAPRSRRPRSPAWSAALAKVAAVSRADGALEGLLEAAGFGHDPALTFVIKRVKKARPPEHELPRRFRFIAYADEDPYVLVPLELVPAIA